VERSRLISRRHSLHKRPNTGTRGEKQANTGKVLGAVNPESPCCHGCKIADDDADSQMRIMRSEKDHEPHRWESGTETNDKLGAQQLGSRLPVPLPQKHCLAMSA
jgi:hypothetical protein